MAVYLNWWTAFFYNMDLFGRTKLYTSYEEINEKNIIEVMSLLNGDFFKNKGQIEYLYNYYKGRQDILNRTKELNEWICAKIVENRFKEVVDFHTQYSVGDPIKYSANNQDFATQVDVLNDFCRLEGKETEDFNLIKWYNICGTAYRMILPKREEGLFDSPFFITTLDPRTAGVAYTTKVPHVPKICWYVTTDTNGEQTWTIYAKNLTGNIYFEVKNNQVLKSAPYPLSELPIIEYPCGEDRLSVAEVILPLANAINLLDSNRLDGVEQQIQSLLVLTNCKLPDDWTANTIKEMGLIELISNENNRATVEQIATKLDQTNTQTLKEDLLQAIRTIASLPNTNGRSSGGDNGLAVVYREGWEGAYEHAMGDQKNIDRSEYMAIKLMLEICEATGKLSIPMRAISIDYTRQHYENIATKSQVLIAMLNNDKIHPKTAYEACGLFYDPNKKFTEGMEWFESQQGKEVTLEESSRETEEVEI